MSRPKVRRRELRAKIAGLEAELEEARARIGRLEAELDAERSRPRARVDGSRPSSRLLDPVRFVRSLWP